MNLKRSAWSIGVFAVLLALLNYWRGLAWQSTLYAIVVFAVLTLAINWFKDRWS
jgi:MFS superfamily sulfate permease-like transporter